MPKFATDESWTGPITLTHTEFWSCRIGRVLIETVLDAGDPEPELQDGTSLEDPQGITIAAGLSVYHRKNGGGVAEINRTVLGA